MKKILITQRVDFISQYNEKRDGLDQRWFSLLEELDFIPVIAPNNLGQTKKIIDQILVDGIIISGGNDLYALGGDTPERDLVERYVINFGVSKNIPIIGICRGMQALQNYFGVELRRVDGHIGSHVINTEYGSFVVTSYHNYGATNTVNELCAWATSNDGVIEGVSHRINKIMGIMWHPERELGASREFSKKLIIDFIK